MHEARPGRLVGRLEHLGRQPQERERAHHRQLRLRQIRPRWAPVRQIRQSNVKGRVFQTGMQFNSHLPWHCCAACYILV